MVNISGVILKTGARRLKYFETPLIQGLDFLKNFVYSYESNQNSMNKKSQIIGIEIDELRRLIQQTVRCEIENCLKECRFGLEYKDEVWDRKTLANFLKISPDKVAYLFKKKELPGHMLGREYVFLKSQILKLFDN